VTQLVSAIGKVAREVPGAAEQIAAVCTGHDYGKPGKPGCHESLKALATRPRRTGLIQQVPRDFNPMCPRVDCTNKPMASDD
jgi:hypothetical protein